MSDNNSTPSGSVEEALDGLRVLVDALLREADEIRRMMPAVTIQTDEGRFDPESIFGRIRDCLTAHAAELAEIRAITRNALSQPSEREALLERALELASGRGDVDCPDERTWREEMASWLTQARKEVE